MKTKSYDCVEMKHKAASILQNETKNMTEEELLDFWKKRTDQLKKKQQKAKLTNIAAKKH